MITDKDDDGDGSDDDDDDSHDDDEDVQYIRSIEYKFLLSFLGDC